MMDQLFCLLVGLMVGAIWLAWQFKQRIRELEAERHQWIESAKEQRQQAIARESDLLDRLLDKNKVQPLRPLPEEPKKSSEPIKPPVPPGFASQEDFDEQQEDWFNEEIEHILDQHPGEIKSEIERSAALRQARAQAIKIYQQEFPTYPVPAALEHLVED